MNKLLNLIGLGICSKSDIEPEYKVERKAKYPFCNKKNRIKILKEEKFQIEEELRELEIDSSFTE
ncbi:hypothetical protein JXM83_04960 [Candidatus Woesearchaeota archaeon]|nr:hypothetical protein [Candidatus Woesearchaeota archaeon]